MCTRACTQGAASWDSRFPQAWPRSEETVAAGAQLDGEPAAVETAASHQGGTPHGGVAADAEAPPAVVLPGLLGATGVEAQSAQAGVVAGAPRAEGASPAAGLGRGGRRKRVGPSGRGGPVLEQAAEAEALVPHQSGLYSLLGPGGWTPGAAANPPWSSSLTPPLAAGMPSDLVTLCGSGAPIGQWAGHAAVPGASPEVLKAASAVRGGGKPTLAGLA